MKIENLSGFFNHTCRSLNIAHVMKIIRLKFKYFNSRRSTGQSDRQTDWLTEEQDERNYYSNKASERDNIVWKWTKLAVINLREIVFVWLLLSTFLPCDALHCTVSRPSVHLSVTLVYL